MIGVYDERPPRKVKRSRWTGENAENGDHPPRRPGEEKRITPPAPARPTAARVPAPGPPLTRRSHRDRPREPPRKGVVQATLRWVPGASGASLLSLPYRFGSSMMQPCHAVALSTRHQICSQRHRLHTRRPRRRRRSTWPLPCAGICCRRICLTRSSGWMTVNLRRFLRQRSTRRSDAASCRRVWLHRTTPHRDRGRGMSLPRGARRTLRFSR
jgi:hypothetical protein